MSRRTFFAGSVLAIALTAGGAGIGPLAAPRAAGAKNCVGRHTSEMAREHGGMRAATEHHNEMHGTDLSVGEHETYIREELCDR